MKKDGQNELNEKLELVPGSYSRKESNPEPAKLNNRHGHSLDYRTRAQVPIGTVARTNLTRVNTPIKAEVLVLGLVLYHQYAAVGATYSELRAYDKQC
jgi:hypothetical protein